MRARAWVVAGLLLALPGLARAALTCPSAAPLSVFVRNLSADPEVRLTVDGEIVDENASCAGDGAVTYATTVRCVGQGTVPCDRIAGLRPGAWIHRVAVTVSGSAEQVQAQRTVLMGAGGSNVVVWTIYPQTFVVGDATEAALRDALAAATAFTDGGGAAALVTFSRAAFPGPLDPKTIDLVDRSCDEPFNEHCSAIRLEGSRLTLDALDARAAPGAVTLAIGDFRHSVVRILGAANVLRGLVLRGTTTDEPCDTCQYDTISVSGTGARGTRIEDTIVHGPSKGDAVGVDGGAGVLDDGGTDPVVIDRSELADARDKGLKVTTGSSVEIRRSCVHDNRNGGVQSALGGRIVALENVVQHNVPGAAQNGLSAGGDPGPPSSRSTLTTNGNIVRFAGSRGLSVADNGAAIFSNDYVSDAQFAGARIETRQANTLPAARFRGVTLACNNDVGITGVCDPPITFDEDVPCLTDADCCGGDLGCCAGDLGCTTASRCKRNPSVDGFGGVVARVCPTCVTPSVDFGTDGDPGNNAFTRNPSLIRVPSGVNLKLSLPGIGPDVVVSAIGNQWEHCGTSSSCDDFAIDGNDIVAAGGRVDASMAAAARGGRPVPSTFSPPRPAAGDVVRIFGRGFNAIEGAACFPGTEPDAPCDVDNPNMLFANACPGTGNCVELLMGTQKVSLVLAAVTPTMIAFRMPVDCYGPATIRVARRTPENRIIDGTMPFCDASGCADRPATEPCDDGDLCTLSDHCSGTDATCVGGTPRACVGACLSGACDPVTGCVAAGATTACDDGDPCTAGDHCSGTGDVCTPGTNPCGQCTTGICGPGGQCTPLAADATCDDGDACTDDDHCDGAGGCAGTKRSCDDDDPCTHDVCVGDGSCQHPAFHDFAAITCRTVVIGDATAGTPGARRLGRVLAAAGRASDGAAEAKGRGDLRGALVQLRRAKARLQTAASMLRRGHGMSAQQLRDLRDVARAALAEVSAQRETIVEALAGVG